MAKRALPIHELLKWAYLELRKQPEDGGLGGPSMFGSSFWDLATRVDHSGFATPDVDLVGNPHADASRLVKHVEALPTPRVKWSRDQRWLLGDLQPFLRVDDLVDLGLLVRPRARRNGKISHARVSREMESVPGEPTPRLVMRHAVLGQIPKWDTGPVALVPMLSADRKPIEEGPAIRLEGKLTNVACPLELDPCAANIALIRWNYHRYVLALEQLVVDCRDLSEYVALPSGFDRTPWFSPSEFSDDDSLVPQRQALLHSVDIST